MEELLLEEFQTMTGELLMRNTSMVDMMSKLSTTCGKINRALTKAATDCGCISFCAVKKDLSEPKQEAAHMEGTLCPICREEVEKAVGEHLFYLASLLNPLELNLCDVLLNEKKRVEMLGKYNLR